MTQRLTTDDFKHRVKMLVGNDYEVIGDYQNTQTKILMRHTVCHFEYEVTPSNFLLGRRCPNCFGLGRIPKSLDQFKQEVFELVGDEYQVHGTYIGANHKILMYHSTCQSTYLVRPNTFLRGCRCPHCASVGRTRKTTSQFNQEVFDLVGNEYQVLEPYQKSNLKLRFKHQVCQQEYTVTPNNFLKGSRCPFCFQKKRKSTKSSRLPQG